MLNEPNESETQHQCPNCGAAFTCGLQADCATCWCFTFPHVITADNSTRKGCLCPKCLRQLIEHIQQTEEAGSQPQKL
jgi:cysteine-rich CWC protein